MSRRQKVALQSFFIDYYDHWFDSRHEPGVIVWERRGDLPPWKEDQFRMMNAVGLETPHHGTASELLEYLDDDTEVVAYYDPRGHATQGKYRTELGRVYYPEMYCSTFIKTEGPPTHTRIVHIGDRSVEFTMTSDHEWMSNTGHDISMAFVSADCHPRHFEWPIYAVDYVDGLAVDLNRCPGLSNTPVEDVLTPKECADAIIEWAQVFSFDWEGEAA